MALQTLVVHPVLDGLETQLQPRRQMLKKKNEGKLQFSLTKKTHFITKNNKKAYF